MHTLSAYKRPRKWVTTIILATFVAVASGACAADYTDARMEPLAATASDLARAVRYFVKKHPSEASTLNDQDLVKQATAHDPQLLGPYGDFVVKGTAQGIILVCTKDQTRGLIEDAECTDKVDVMSWRDKTVPCNYTLDIKVVCPGMK